MSETTVEHGTLSIHSENIFPIIKKWLYTERDIFLRELVSNAVDAITKLRQLAVSEGLDLSGADGRIDLTVEAEGRLLRISDNGLGMTADEVRRYINQIAFSSAEEFLAKYKDGGEGGQLIGHFGLGFYSAFMVAERVELESLSYRPGTEPVHWSCDGSTSFDMTPGSRTTRGTEVLLHLTEEAADFSTKPAVREVLERHCGFLPIPIFLDGEQVNETRPLWTRAASDVSEEDYTSFYAKTFGGDEALFWIHLNVDYPFRLKGILFFPKIKHHLDPTGGQIKLFCNQVFVSDNCKELIPEFLLLLRGVIDTPDLPLNVSRSALQREPVVAKISAHIIKKIADRLGELHSGEKERYEGYWADIHPFIKYGMMRDERFYEKAKDVVIFRTSGGGYTTLDDYLKRNEGKHKNKIYYASDEHGQAGYLELFRKQGLEALLVDDLIDPHFLQFLEYKNSLLHFARVDSDLCDELVEASSGSRILDPKDQKNSEEKVRDLFRKVLELPELTVELKTLKSDEVAAVLLIPEYSRRLHEMSRLLTKEVAPAKEDHTLVLNGASGLVKSLLRLADHGASDAKVQLVCRHLYDLALMAHRQLDQERLQAFLRRSEQLLEQLAQKSLIIS
ncbi:MAG: molecular chaperone HtpG [Deltaproteobacteria bacterium RIFOXYA12_FULL_61_11]|nr:MAG: molecular chaperone HtpG [Deltaproteobacteria bacterium RIFOXYA12_FULL_61_11]